MLRTLLSIVTAAALVPAAQARPEAAPPEPPEIIVVERIDGEVAYVARGRAYPTASGARVRVVVSDGYAVDEAERLRWAALLDSLVHGPELEEVTFQLAPRPELDDRCGAYALACYLTNTKTILATGFGDPGGIGAEALVMHEYGHHVARSRLNSPWGALSDGTKRWASYMGICAGVREGRFFPQISFGPLYRLNPAEGFAEAYRVLNERRLGVAETPWLLVDRRFYPDTTALALLEQDVLEPWRGNTRFTLTGRDSRVFRIATPLDGALRVSVASGPRTVYRVSAPATICGRRSALVRVRHVRGGGPFRLTVSRP
ncbi:MAG: hypothetical protein ICV64_03885 [Thermoleophilia bacterium]|nr:hypothetical protein [Thermoleophilia bacterium]